MPPAVAIPRHTAAWARAHQALEALRSWVELRDFAGWDPYDGLNSPVLRVLCARSKWGRLACIQAMKRSPVNLRRVLLVPPGHNPKALALFLEAYVKLARAWRDDACRSQAGRLVELLAASCTATPGGHGWGYNFDWQSRAFFAPRGTPTVVCSSFVGHALLDAYESLSNARALDLAVPIAGFLLTDLKRLPENDTFCFSYTPLDDYAVHNANVLGASLLLRLSGVTGETAWRDAALGALAYTMRHQNPDGSWHYSERPGSRWIDSFHTGFVLESIRRSFDLGEIDHYREAYRRGVTYYAANFFLSDGAPKYYHDRLYPIDIHSPAEAVAFFSAEKEGQAGLVRRVLGWTLDNMQDPSGYFYFRRSRSITNRIPYMRWSQAWMFRALASVLVAAS
jgi:hypothetical protein